MSAQSATSPPQRPAEKLPPFSKRHRRYWLPITGGMIFIGVVNVAIGYWLWPKDENKGPPKKIELKIPPPSPGNLTPQTPATPPDAALP